MISDEQHDQASLYALGALSAEERTAFERELAGDAELQALVSELRETAAALALSAPQVAPSAGVKDRVTQQIESEAGRVVPMTPAPRRSAIAVFVPWAIAAGVTAFCGMLLNERAKLNRQLTERVEPSSLVLIPLKASADGPAEAQAVVAWDPAQQTGMIKIANLPRAGRGKDYQLWAVDAAHADPIDAGVVHVNASGETKVQFKPNAPARRIKAFALSLEREGGVPKREGPILLIGTS
jgi:anti-sigma-K factor RskA